MIRTIRNLQWSRWCFTAPFILGFMAFPVRGSFAAPPVVNSQVEMTGDETGLANNTCKKWPPNKKFTVTIPREAELEQLVQWMMSISCEKFIWTTKVRSGKVTLLSPVEVTLEEAYAAFYAALEQIGLTLERSGKYFKIVESAEAGKLNIPLYNTSQSGPNNDRFITQLIRVENANPKEVFDVLNNLKSKQGSVNSVGSLLILTDRGTIVNRLMSIIQELDQNDIGDRIFFYQLENADAQEVAKIVTEIFSNEKNQASRPPPKRKGKRPAAAASTPAASSFSRVIVDERTGTLIIVTDEGDYAMISKLIRQLDVRLPGGGGRIRIKRLKYADPKQLTTVLQQITNGAKKNRNSKSKASSKTQATDQLLTGDIMIAPDQGTRSLVIAANAAAYKELEKIIDGLDVERRQVYVEVYLLETSIGRTIGGGAGGHAAFPHDIGGDPGVGVVRSSPAPDINSLNVAGSAALSGLTAGLLGAAIEGSGQILGTGQDIPSFGVILQALERDSDVNIVSYPHLTIADNDEGTAEFGSRVPTPGALSFGGGGTTGASLLPLQSVNREDVTLRLKVTPHVTDEKTVTLDVEITDQAIESTDPVLGVTTTKRQMKQKSILAQDDQPVVIGGLLKEVERESTQQIPGLGSIPILGWLFKRKEVRKEKLNLLVVLVPHILDGPDEIREIHELRADERRQFLERETRFRHRDSAKIVNYRKKAGLLSTIDSTARHLENKELLLRQAEVELHRDSLTGELGLDMTPNKSDTSLAGKKRASESLSGANASSTSTISRDSSSPQSLPAPTEKDDGGNDG